MAPMEGSSYQKSADAAKKAQYLALSLASLDERLTTNAERLTVIDFPAPARNCGRGSLAVRRVRGRASIASASGSVGVPGRR